MPASTFFFNWFMMVIIVLTIAFIRDGGFPYFFLSVSMNLAAINIFVLGLADLPLPHILSMVSVSLMFAGALAYRYRFKEYVLDIHASDEDFLVQVIVALLVLIVTIFLAQIGS